MLDRRTFALADPPSSCRLWAARKPDAAAKAAPTAERKTNGHERNRKQHKNRANLSKRRLAEPAQPEEFPCLRKKGTERPVQQSHLMMRSGPAKTFTWRRLVLCRCFKTEMKFDFAARAGQVIFTFIDGAVETKRDFKMIVPRLNNHLSQTGGGTSRPMWFNDDATTGLR